MSELLDAFDDEGLADIDTRRFLVEALANAEPADWQDILEPFLPPARALAALNSVPGVLQRSLSALAVPEDGGPALGADPAAQAFLFFLPGRVLYTGGLHTAVRCARLCRAAQEAFAPATAAGALFWQRTVEASAACWQLPLPKEGTWRDRYLALLHPRLDGIYGGECSFKRYVRLGHHADLRKNAAALAYNGGRGCTSEWLYYRRYVRLLPGTAGCLRALVLQDACPRGFAERVLAEGVDLEMHQNPGKPEGIIGEGLPESAADPARLRKRICLGSCMFLHKEQRLEIRYTAGGSAFYMSFKLSHGGPGHFAACLDWEDYTRTEENGEVLTFNLGRLPDYMGGGLMNEDMDHFPAMLFRPKIALEHLL